MMHIVQAACDINLCTSKLPSCLLSLTVIVGDMLLAVMAPVGQTATYHVFVRDCMLEGYMTRL